MIHLKKYKSLVLVVVKLNVVVGKSQRLNERWTKTVTQKLNQDSGRCHKFVV